MDAEKILDRHESDEDLQLAFLERQLEIEHRVHDLASEAAAVYERKGEQIPEHVKSALDSCRPRSPINVDEVLSAGYEAGRFDARNVGRLIGPCPTCGWDMVDHKKVIWSRSLRLVFGFEIQLWRWSRVVECANCAVCIRATP